MNYGFPSIAAYLRWSILVRRARKLPIRNNSEGLRASLRDWKNLRWFKNSAGEVESAATEAQPVRRQVWRTTADAEQYAMLRPEPRLLAPQYRCAQAFHLGVHPSRPPLELLHELRAVVERSPAGACERGPGC